MHSIVETEIFIKRANDANVTEAELDDIKQFLALHPDAGNVIPSTVGSRKLRWATRGKGKSGGYRIITFYSGNDIPVFLLDIYTKNEKDNLTQAERNYLKKVLSAMADTYRYKNNE